VNVSKLTRSPEDVRRKKLFSGKLFTGNFMFGSTPVFTSIILACLFTVKYDTGNYSLARIAIKSRANVEEFDSA